MHFVIHIFICESDRWELLNRYQKDTVYIRESDSQIYKIDGEDVTKEEIEKYLAEEKRLRSRFDMNDAKLKFRSNLIYWLTHHYKVDGLKSPINDWREKAYKQECERRGH